MNELTGTPARELTDLDRAYHQLIDARKCWEALYLPKRNQRHTLGGIEVNLERHIVAAQEFLMKLYREQEQETKNQLAQSEK